MLPLFYINFNYILGTRVVKKQFPLLQFPVSFTRSIHSATASPQPSGGFQFGSGFQNGNVPVFFNWGFGIK
jgi:hypothetical protein